MKWLIGTILGLVLLIGGMSIYLQPNSFIGCASAPIADADKGEKCTPADAIVVVSGGDTEARTAAGIELYKQGWATYLVLSGAALDKTGPSNAATMEAQAQAAGVPASAILLDEDASNTQQNASNSTSIFKEYDFTDVILVTSGYHQRRASLEFNKSTGDTVMIRNYPVSDSDWQFFWWLTPRGWWLAGGEIAKIVAFYVGVSS